MFFLLVIVEWMRKFQIMCFILKIYHNYKSYQNMLIILNFNIFNHNYFFIYIIYNTPY
jgi:hypothetical protein